MRHILFNTRGFLESYINLPVNENIPPKTTEHNTAFITGATGFIGGFLLKELLEQKKFKSMICLVRGDDHFQARERLIHSLTTKGLDPSRINGQLEVLTGDVTQPSFGLSENSFHRLASRTHTVYHFAATMNWVAPFNQDTVGNIHALKEILRLCSVDQTKPLHYASSVGAWSLYDGPKGTLYEDHLHEEGENLPGGYCQAKWINERICQLAREVGIPITIYRIGDVKGDAVSGLGDPNNFGNILMRFFLERGIIFESKAARYNYLPVNYLAKAIAHLSMQPVSQTFQFSNSQYVSNEDIYEASKDIGYPLQYVSEDQWMETLRHENGIYGKTLKPVFKRFRPDVSYPPTSMFEIGLHLFGEKHDTTNSDHYLTQAGIECPAILRDKVLENYLIHLSKSLPLPA